MNDNSQTAWARARALVGDALQDPEVHEYVRQNNFLTVDSLVDETGYQKCTVSYPEISADEIFKSVESFYRRYYFRPKYIWKSIKKMASSREEAKRLLGEGVQFIDSMRKRRKIAQTPSPSA